MTGNIKFWLAIFTFKWKFWPKNWNCLYLKLSTNSQTSQTFPSPVTRALFKILIQFMQKIGKKSWIFFSFNSIYIHYFYLFRHIQSLTVCEYKILKIHIANLFDLLPPYLTSSKFIGTKNLNFSVGCEENFKGNWRFGEGLKTLGFLIWIVIFYDFLCEFWFWTSKFNRKLANSALSCKISQISSKILQFPTI